MKSQKGVTMLSLVIYVASFVLVAGIVGTITTYFYNNMKIIDTNIGSSSEYNKLNLYFIKQTKTDGVSIDSYNSSDSADKYITFLQADGTKNTFVKLGDILYYNNIKLCSNVEDFKTEVDTSTGKTIVKVFFKVSGTAFSTNYVLN